MTQRRAVALTFLVALIATLAIRHPSADISILTHDRADPAPHRMQAAVDLGIGAFSILVTWTAGESRM
ncbi:hypothetical protein KY084_02775 [Stakelama sp. CBK3Z-3]|uniref:Uncharacterized protein n=1 Tax=Stakelama flava TaxID=2860338 RepID=A0ABS6XHW3_9SPHN|nr:hypothetical protein [Stakelama flava]MBW4329798.1 hypothetical protein [Stakelama flava]